MRIKFIKTNISPIKKICLAGLFMALAVILQKVVAVNYLAFAPFARVSFGGPALIMFASILLGPVYGAFVVAGSDIFGYLFFDPHQNPYFFQVTIIYAVLGFVSYFVFSLVFSLSSKKKMLLIEIISFIAIWIAVTMFILFSNIYNTPLWAKIVIPVGSGLILVGVSLFSIFYKGKDDNPVISPMHICFASFVCDFFVMLILGSLMKAWAFGFSLLPAILLVQAVTLFINVTLDTMFISTFQRFTKKYFVRSISE